MLFASSFFLSKVSIFLNDDTNLCAWEERNEDLKQQKKKSSSSRGWGEADDDGQMNVAIIYDCASLSSLNVANYHSPAKEIGFSETHLVAILS